VVALFAGFSIYADFGGIARRIHDFSWTAIAFALGLAAINYAIRWARWQLYLARVEVVVPKKTSVLVFIAAFALSVTPGKLGELVKSFLLRDLRNIPVATTAPIVLAERITDVLALVLLGCAGALVYGVARTLAIASIAVVSLAIAALSWPGADSRVVCVLTSPTRLRRFREPLEAVCKGLRQLMSPRALMSASTLGVIAWTAECLGFAVIVNAFSGASISIGLAVVIYASTTLAGALSFLPGGLVVTEASMVVMLVHLATGIDTPTAIAATLLTRLATLWFAVALGILALLWLQTQLPRDRTGDLKDDRARGTDESE